MNFETTFLTSLLAEEKIDLDAEGDQQELEKSTDSTAEEGQYEIEGSETSPEQVISKIKDRALKWSGELQDFAEFLNGTDPQSLINQVQSTQRHAAFEGIADQTQKEIGKVALTLAGLREKIRMFVNIADSKFEKSVEEKNK